MTILAKQLLNVLLMLIGALVILFSLEMHEGAWTATFGLMLSVAGIVRLVKQDLKRVYYLDGRSEK